MLRNREEGETEGEGGEKAGLSFITLPLIAMTSCNTIFPTPKAGSD